MRVQLDTESFAAAILRLAEGVAALAAEPDNTLLRDGVIQRFEFTYELSHAMLRRYLAMTAADPQSVRSMSFQDLIRTGSERGLLRSDWERWREWRRAREVAAVIPDFLLEARHPLRELQQRGANP